MRLPPWLAELRDWYSRFWTAPEARQSSRDSGRPDWLLVLLPFLLVAAAVAVLLIAIAVKR